MVIHTWLHSADRTHVMYCFFNVISSYFHLAETGSQSLSLSSEGKTDDDGDDASTGPSDNPHMAAS